VITGTPYAASRDGVEITVHLIVGEMSTSVRFACGSSAEAAQSIEMWKSLIHVAIHDPANDEDTTELGLDDEVEV